MRRIRAVLQNPTFLRRFHGYSTIGWLLAAVPICIFLKDSIEFLVFISVWAIIVSHWEGWMTALGMKKTKAEE